MSPHFTDQPSRLNKGMNEENTLSPDELELPRGVTSANGHARHRNGAAPTFNARPTMRPAMHDIRPDKKVRFDADAGSFIDAMLRRWWVMFFASAIMFCLGLLLALTFWGRSFTSTSQLILNEPTAISELFRPQEFSTATLVAMIESPEVLKKTGAKMDPVLKPKDVKSRLEVNSDYDTDITTITTTTKDPVSAAALNNAFLEEAVRHTQEVQRQEALGSERYLQRQIDESAADIRALRDSMPAALSSLVPAAAGPDKLKEAQNELTTLLLRYTEAHPLVREQRARLAALAEQIAASPAVDLKPQANDGPMRVNSQHDYEVALGKLKGLEDNHAALITRQRLGELIKETPPGYFRILLPAAPADAIEVRPWLKIGIVSVFFGCIGLALGAGEILSREFLDKRLKTEADVKRVTRLPLIGSLGDLRKMSAAEQNTWAFRSWIALQGRLQQASTGGLICGITSSRAGDGRSTWIRLLSHAASQCGFRVLTITATPPAKPDAPASEEKKSPSSQKASSSAEAAGGTATATATTQELATLNSSHALSTPAQVADKLRDSEEQSMVHIPLPGWVWNLERRRQWQHAMEMWRKIDNIVILVELPPATEPDSVLLSENLPNLIWLADGGRSDAMETRNQVDTLRHARTHLVGCALNRASSSFLNGRFARWMGCWAAFAVLGLGSAPDVVAQNNSSFMDVPAETTPPAQQNPSAVRPATPPAQPSAQAQSAQPAPARAAVDQDSEPADARPQSFSVNSRAQRAEWQKRLTLGPGDVLNLSLFGAPDFKRDEVPIGPDGRISFLEAQNVMAAGLTVDELRERLAEELGKFRRAPQPIVQPFAYRSKKYVVLGKVVEKGVFTLDRPITVIEAVARAGGLETGLADRNLVELADFSRAFLARDGKHLPINFEKLFLEGDLSQNIPLEPNDYLYFPASDLREVYVLGEVALPGAQIFGTGAGALSAIAARGGFTDRAWKKRLLVIRGSLNNPQTFVVNAHEVLAAQTPDFKLQPKDIIYVSARPWIRAEELLDIAATAFVEGAVVGLTGRHLYSN